MSGQQAVDLLQFILIAFTMLILMFHKHDDNGRMK